MKKTLIALTIATLPLSAMADVTLYGKIKAGVEFSKSKGVNNTITNANDWGSRIGFKGQEDLGNGIKAIWQVEQKVNVGGKSTGFGTRDSFIGLATDFGTIRAGYISNYINSDMADVDPWEGNSINTLGIFGRTENRHTGVRFDSADYAGFSFAAQFAMEDNTRNDQLKGVATAGDTLPLTGAINDTRVIDSENGKKTENRQVFGLGFTYENAGIFAKLGAEGIRTDDKYRQAYRFEGGYDANNIFAALGYQFTKDYDMYETTHEVALTGAYTIGNITPRLTVAYGLGEVDGASDEDYIQAIIGADYAFSKRTTALVNFGWMKADKGSEWAAPTGSPKGEGYHFGVGMVHNF